MPAPRVLVTRPEREALHWVAALQARGIAAQALPLMAITAPADTSALHAARQRLAGYDAVMVVSGNAAQHFFESNTALALAPQAPVAIKTRVWVPGPGTAKTLQTLGVDAARIDQPAADALQFDSEALWAQVRGQIRPGMRVLIVRGTESDADTAPSAPNAGTGRDWLACQLQAAGAQVDFVVAYVRGAPLWTPAQRALAQQASSDASLWLLSSSQALAHLCAALPGQCWAQARALVTHPRIAQAARAAGFGWVKECRPALTEVVASIESQHEPRARF
ncbi:MAG: uroporphyrinogen-III synthase [Burkholderiaceae bacterium]|nr:uroporphyrinogen-III synthase [Burkholderiaceae bacterium]